MGKGPEQTLLQGGHTEDPEIYKRMLSITSHQGHANSNHNEMPLHIGQNDHHKCMFYNFFKWVFLINLYRGIWDHIKFKDFMGLLKILIVFYCKGHFIL